MAQRRTNQPRERTLLRGGVSARGLTGEQSAMLAAVLPNPRGWNPTKPTRTLLSRQQRILQREQHANFPKKLLNRR